MEKISLKNNVIWSTFAPASFQIIKIIFSILIARILEPSDFGIFAIATTIIYYTNNFSSLGMGNSIVQKKFITDDHINSFFSFNFIFSLCLMVLCLYFSVEISKIFNDERLSNVISALSSLYLITAFYAVPFNILRRNAKFKIISLLEITSNAVNIIVCIVLAFLNYRYWSLVLGTLISNLVTTLIALYIVDKKIKLNFRFRFFYEIIEYGLWNFFYQQAKLITDSFEKLLIGKIYGSTNLGLYDKANSFANIPSDLITNRLSNLSYIVFSRSQDKPEDLKSSFEKLFLISVFITFPAYVGLYFISDSFVTIVLGEKWIGSIIFIKIFSLSFLIGSIGNVFYNINMTCGSYKPQVIITFIITIISINFFLIIYLCKIDMVYFAYCGCLSNTLSTIGSVYFSLKILKISIKGLVSLFTTPCIGSLLMLTAMWLTEKIFIVESFYSVVISAIIGGLVYSIFTFKKIEVLKRRM